MTLAMQMDPYSFVYIMYYATGCLRSGQFCSIHLVLYHSVISRGRAVELNYQIIFMAAF
jgi:hypothetical protein